MWVSKAGRYRALESVGFYRAAERVSAAAGFLRGPCSAAALGAISLAACTTVPVTGRSSLNAFSLDQDRQLGAEAYSEVLKNSRIVDKGPDYELVKRVTDRLIQVADDPGFDWEVHVIDDPKTINAWCMPGGKMAVYTGILPITKDEVGLAVVMGHEIGHAIARHGTERMTSQGGAEIGLAILGAYYDSVAQYQELIGTTLNLAVFMPWGRNHELEADHIGLIYMARAGYDPREAVKFWQRMANSSGGDKPPEFLSTHPSDEHRIREIEGLLPEALAEYRRVRGGG